MTWSVWSVWKAFWGELNTPDSFQDDPYGAVTNQSAHVLWGLWASVAICMGYLAIMGEMPDRIAVFLLIAFGYPILIEKFTQRWSGADSIVDTMFVSLGAAAPLVSLKEVAFKPNLDLRLQFEGTVAIMVAIPVLLLAHWWPRAARKYWPKAR